MAIPATPAPDYKNQSTTMRVKHSDMPELADSKLGDKVHIHLHGTVKSVTSPNEYSDGETEIHVHKLHGGEADGDGINEGEGNPPSSEEAKTLPLESLRKRLPHKD